MIYRVTFQFKDRTFTHSRDIELNPVPKSANAVNHCLRCEIFRSYEGMEEKFSLRDVKILSVNQK